MVLYVLPNCITPSAYDFVRYEKRKRKASPDVATYHFAGYTSLYSFYHYPEKIRLRLRCEMVSPISSTHAHGVM